MSDCPTCCRGNPAEPIPLPDVDSAGSPARGVALSGVALGFLSVVFWAIYNVGSDLADADGFRPVDLAFFRFVVGGLCLLPLLIAFRRYLPPLRQLLVLCLLAGPIFGLLVATGFRYAPLSHAVVVPPATSIIVTTLLVCIVEGERFSGARALGAAILIGGLVVLALDAPTANASRRPVWLGDLCFILSGSLWGAYTFMLARWRLPAVPTAAAIAVISGIIFAPVYFLFFGLVELSPRTLASQAFYQGLIGGALSFVTFAGTVTRLGASRAALFFALVPPAAAVLAIPMMNTFPNTIQVISIGLATLGITVSFASSSSVAPRAKSLANAVKRR